MLIFAGCSLFLGPEEPQDTTPKATANIEVSSLQYALSRGYQDRHAVAVIEGLKINLKGIAVNATDGQTYTMWDANESNATEGVQIDLRSSGDITRLTKSVTLPAGEYNKISMNSYNHYSLKAYAIFGNSTYYTTSTGIANGSSIDNSTYDFYHYGFIYPDGTTAPDNTTIKQEEINLPAAITIDANKTYSFKLLIDLYRLANFWSGDFNASDPQLAYPFQSVYNSTHQSSYFPTGSPNFAMGYLPVIMAIGDENDTTFSPVYETYIIDKNSTSDTNRTLNNGVITFAFKNSSATIPYWGRIRNFEQTGGNIKQLVKNFAAQTTFPSAATVGINSGYDAYTEYTNLIDANATNGFGNETVVSRFTFDNYAFAYPNEANAFVGFPRLNVGQSASYWVHDSSGSGGGRFYVKRVY